MRISDWSSDVCSSDLYAKLRKNGRPAIDALICYTNHHAAFRFAKRIRRDLTKASTSMSGFVGICERPFGHTPKRFRYCLAAQLCLYPRCAAIQYRPASQRCFSYFVTSRSEAHTSELQSLMRILYAVLRLHINIITPL